MSSRYTDTRRRTEGGSGWGVARVYDAYGQLRFGDRLEAQSDAVGYNGQWGYYTDIASLAASGNGLGSEAAQAGLVLCTYRYYSPDLARWLTRDPLGYEGGINVYAYCEDNPIGMIDPSGLYTIGGFEFTLQGVSDGLQTGLSVTIDSLTFGAIPSDRLGDVGATESGYCGIVAREALLQAATLGAANALRAGKLAQAARLTRLVKILQKACFVAGTPISMADGSFKPIEQVKQGDMVASRNEATGETSVKRVTAVKVRTAHELVKISLVDTTGKIVETIEATPEHPFYVDGKGFTPAGQLAIGNSIATRVGPTLSVKELVREARPEGVTVYNFTVEDDHTYFVGKINGGLWVHNWYKFHGVNPDWITKGAHITVDGVEYVIRPGINGTIVFKNFFGRQIAVDLAYLLKDRAFVEKLLSLVEKGIPYAAKEGSKQGIEKSAELKFLAIALRKILSTLK